MNFIKKYKLSLIVTFSVVLFFVRLVTGDPLTKAIAGKTINNYINRNYPDCYVGKYSYDFTCNGYSALICSQTNSDVNFYIHTDSFGFSVVSDNYVYVENGQTVSRRLDEEYTEIIQQIIGDTICGYDIHRLFGCMADNEASDYQYSLKSGPLVPGKEYDIYKISATDGDITLRVIAPDATAETAEKILQSAYQLLKDNGLMFDTISLDIGQDNDCWPYIISIEQLSHTAFENSNLRSHMDAIAVYENPQWKNAYDITGNRYTDIVNSIGWDKTDKAICKKISAGFYITGECAQKAYSNNTLVSENGLEMEDIDRNNYRSYTDAEILKLAKKAGHLEFDVQVKQTDNRVAADIINEITEILKQNNILYYDIDLKIRDNSSSYVTYEGIPYTEKSFTAEDMKNLLLKSEVS